jgi:hypothetical protein
MVLLLLITVVFGLYKVNIEALSSLDRIATYSFGSRDDFILSDSVNALNNGEITPSSEPLKYIQNGGLLF